MEGQYSVTVSGQSVGKVVVHRQGLYYLFSCRCALSGAGIYRLAVTSGSECETLGILVPKDGSFVLETKVPVKRFGKGEMVFSLISRHERSTGTFIPISPEEPFAYIARLKKSFLVLREGQPGIYLQEKQEC